MIVKPSTDFINRSSDSELVATTGAIIMGMTNNPDYPTPSPTLADVSAKSTAFSDAMAAAAGGGVQLTAEKNARRAELAASLRLLASYAQTACNGDLAVLLSSGFPIQKPQRQPIGVLPAPSDLRVRLGGVSGALDASASPVYGAGVYNWKLVATSAPNVVLQTAQTTGARTSFTGLTPGVEYSVTLNAVGSAGPSDWANPVSQIVI